MGKKRTYRMYGLVPYNLSPIQQGIQFGHAVVEYSLEWSGTSPYKKWSSHDKTFIILNGGTTNSRRFNGEYVGTINQHAKAINDRGIINATFSEPDLNDALTAIVFIVDDRVFDHETWPDYTGLMLMDGITPEATEYANWKSKFDDNEKISDNIIWLRSWLRNFKLA